MMMMTRMTVKRPLRKSSGLPPADQEKSKAGAIASAETNTDTGYYHHGIGYSVIADSIYLGEENQKECSCITGLLFCQGFNQREQYRHQLHGDHQKAAQHHCQYRTHEEDHQPGKGLCIFSEY